MEFQFIVILVSLFHSCTTSTSTTGSYDYLKGMFKEYPLLDAKLGKDCDAKAAKVYELKEEFLAMKDVTYVSDILWKRNNTHYLFEDMYEDYKNTCNTYDPSRFLLKEYWTELTSCFFLISSLERCADMTPREFFTRNDVFKAYATYVLYNLGFSNYTTNKRIFEVEEPFERRDLEALCKNTVVNCMVEKNGESKCINSARETIFKIYYFGYYTNFQRVFCFHKKNSATKVSSLYFVIFLCFVFLLNL